MFSYIVTKNVKEPRRFFSYHYFNYSPLKKELYILFLDSNYTGFSSKLIGKSERTLQRSSSKQ